jgi:hypothetical protein
MYPRHVCSALYTAYCALKRAYGSEVHSSDILRAHTNNIDSDDSDSSKIHWAKWNLIAKFIFEMVHFQDLSRDALEQGHHLRVSRPSIAHMWREAVLMPPEVGRNTSYVFAAC